MQEKILKEIKNLGIKEFDNFNSLNLMDGSYLNLEVELPSGKFAKLLDDNNFIVVYTYGCNGKDAQLVQLKRISL